MLTTQSIIAESLSGVLAFITSLSEGLFTANSLGPIQHRLPIAWVFRIGPQISAPAACKCMGLVMERAPRCVLRVGAVGNGLALGWQQLSPELQQARML